MTLFLLVLLFSDGTTVLPDEPVAYSTQTACMTVAGNLNTDKSRRQHWVAACTPLAVPR